MSGTRWTRIGRLFLRFAFLLSLLFLAILPVANSQPQTRPEYTGMTLEDALRLFQVDGLNLLFSSDLVRPDMKITAEPQSGTSREVVDELLAPFGLRVESGPGKTLLVVKSNAQLDPDYANYSTARPSTGIRSPVETITVPFVTIYLSVRDKSQRPVTNLNASNFIVKEDGKQQSIVEFNSFLSSSERAQAESPEKMIQGMGLPMTVLFLMDSSESMDIVRGNSTAHDQVQKLAIQLLDEFYPEDELTVMGFNDTLWPISPATHNLEEIRSKLREWKGPGGTTALFDAIMTSLQDLAGAPGRKIIIVCSDGKDTSSKIPRDTLFRALQTSDVTVYFFGVSTNTPP
ncbi:MAG TPA: VWA domain-containing protein, partial [Acidobacteriota bacterium]|nr:VWA domain-containing protein [Acidobacteriota bacterium]